MIYSPKVSILIRNLNEEQNLKILFPILNNQDYENFEVIFLDSGSTDKSVEFVKNFSSNFNLVTSSINKEDFTFGKALNICASLTERPTFFISLSAHCFPKSEKFISNYVKNFINYNADIVYGKQVGYIESMISESSHLEYWFDEEYGTKYNIPFTNNGNCGYKFELWNELKFNEKLTGCEDVEFAIRSLRLNKTIAYGKNIEVEHFHQENPKSIYIRYFREALALSSLYQINYSLFKAIKKFFYEIFMDLKFKSTNDRFKVKSFKSIIVYRFNKQLGHYKGFKKNNNFLNNSELYYYLEDIDIELKNNLYDKYLS